MTIIRQATYLGGTNADETRALAVNSGGDVYVVGTTYSQDFPGTAGGVQETTGGGSNDAFVARLNADLTTLHQATYLGGSSINEGYALAVAPGGGVYVAGSTYARRTISRSPKAGPSRRAPGRSMCMSRCCPRRSRRPS